MLQQTEKKNSLVNTSLRIHNTNYEDFPCSGMNGNSKGKSFSDVAEECCQTCFSSQTTETCLVFTWLKYLLQPTGGSNLKAMLRVTQCP